MVLEEKSPLKADLCNLFDRKNRLRSAHTSYRKRVSVRVDLDLSLLRVAVGLTHIAMERVKARSVLVFLTIRSRSSLQLEPTERCLEGKENDAFSVSTPSPRSTELR